MEVRSRDLRKIKKSLKNKLRHSSIANVETYKAKRCLTLKMNKAIYFFQTNEISKLYSKYIYDLPQIDVKINL